MVTAGSNMAFLNCIMAVGDPGDELFCQCPFTLIRKCGSDVWLRSCDRNLSTRIGALMLTGARLRSHHSSDPSHCDSVSPNNPTGAVYSEESLTAVNKLCAEKGIYHFER